jgi:CheY-like chemotaxis protein
MHVADYRHQRRWLSQHNMLQVLRLVIQKSLTFDVIVLDEHFADKMTGSEAIRRLRDR